jgi:hypothetical protein
MNALLGYFLCLAALLPALSLDVFFGVLGKTSRQHDVLVVIRTVVQLLATVTSPFRITLTLAVMLCAFIAESEGSRRGVGFFVLGVAGLGCMLHVVPMDHVAGFGAAIALLPATLASFAGCSCGSRVCADAMCC